MLVNRSSGFQKKKQGRFDQKVEAVNDSLYLVLVRKQ